MQQAPFIVAAIAVALGLASAGCRPAPPAPPNTTAALEPFEEDRVQPVVKVEPEAMLKFALGDSAGEDASGLWTDGDAKNLTSILVFDGDPLPATIAALNDNLLTALLADGSNIRRIDLRIAHDPSRWPEGANPPGEPGLLRSTLYDKPESSAPYTLLFKPGGSVDYTAGSGESLRPLLEYLRDHPALFASALEANTSQRVSSLQEPWVALKIRVNTSPPERKLVPRKDWEAPLAELAETLVDDPGAAAATEGIPFTAAATPDERAGWAEASAEGVPLMQVVDPHATLYTFTLPIPGTASDELQALAQFLADHYLRPPITS